MIVVINIIQILMGKRVVKIQENNIDLLSYCGLFCGACPSYHRGTCFGCRSEDHSQKRTSKWGCKIRDCCSNENEIVYCGECTDFPCAKIIKKLIQSHPKDSRFVYRHEIPENMNEIKELGISKWLENQHLKWKCHECGGVITFYEYKCLKCNKKSEPKFLYKKGDTNKG